MSPFGKPRSTHDPAALKSMSSPVLERSVIKAAVEQPGLFDLLADRLSDEAFVDHAKAWKTAKDLINRGKKYKIPADWTAAADPEDAAALLQDLYRRRVLGAGMRKLVDVFKDRRVIDNLIEPVEEHFQAIIKALQCERVGQPQSVDSLAKPLVDELRERQKMREETGAALIGVPTGFPSLDGLLGGLQEGVHLLAGEPAAGKTSLVIMLATTAATLGCPVVLVSFEESVVSLALRCMCVLTGQDRKALNEGTGDVDRLQTGIRGHVEALRRIFLIEGSGRLTAGQIKERAKAIMKSFNRPRVMVIVDYLQRWSAATMSTDEYRHAVSKMVSRLRELALSLKSPVIAICSQNRPGQGSSRLTSLKESGDLEYSADSAMFLVSRRINVPGQQC